MSKKFLVQLAQALLGLVGTAILILFLSFSIQKSLPQAALTSAYPSLEVAMQTASTSAYPPPDALIPSAQFTQTNTPDRSKIPPPATPIPVSDPSPFYTRATSLGRIIESGFSPFSSRYFIINKWFAENEMKRSTAYAGALRSIASSGGMLEKPWPGVLIIETIDLDGKRMTGESGEYTIEKTGPLRILSADAAGFTLVTTDGQVYLFDLASRTFHVSPVDSLIVRKMLQGEIWETGNVPFPSRDYEFMNYWVRDENGIQTYVLAGVKCGNPPQGVIVRFIYDPKENHADGQVFPLALQGDAVHIVDYADGRVILVSSGGAVLAFDVDSGQFFGVSNGKYVPKQTSIKPAPYTTVSTSEGLACPTSTPAPTNAPLPTYNPYP